MRAQAYRTLLSEVHKLVRLYLTLPITSSTSERSFLSLQQMLTYLWSTVTEKGLNNCLLLHVHIDLTENLDVMEIARDFISENEERQRYFGSFTTE